MDKLKVRELLESGIGYKETGRMVGVSSDAIRTFARSLPVLPVVTRSPWREWEESVAKSMLSKGYSYSDVSNKLSGRSSKSIQWRNYTHWHIKTRQDLWSENEELSAKAMLLSGMRLSKVANAIGRTSDALHVRNAQHWHIRVVQGNNDLPKDDFFEAWSPLMSYILGFIAADGCVNQNLRSVIISQSHADGKDYLERLKAILGGNVYGPNKNDGYVLSVCSRPMAERLNSLGITPAKSLTINMPNVPDGFLKDFVRGVFDGDGCVSSYCKKGEKPDLRASIASGSSEFKTELERRIGEKIGVRGRFSKWEILWKCSFGRAFLDWLYTGKETSLWLPRKYEKYQKLLQDRAAWGNRRIPLEHEADGRFLKQKSKPSTASVNSDLNTIHYAKAI